MALQAPHASGLQAYLNSGLQARGYSIGGAVALDGPVNDFLIFGGKLYICGGFVYAGATLLNRIARWTGSAWAPLGDPPGLNGAARTMIGWNDGSSDCIIVGGDFSIAGATAVTYAAKWDGATWSAMGSRTTGIIKSCLYSGQPVVLPDNLNQIPQQWNGSSWLDLGTPYSRNKYDIYLYGATLLLGEVYSPRSPVRQWNGASWLEFGTTVVMATAYTLAQFDSGLYASGASPLVPLAYPYFVYQYNGISWSALGLGFNGTHYALLDGGSELIAGGSFGSYNGNPRKRIVKWDGSTWVQVGDGIGIGSVSALIEFGGDLWAGGNFTQTGSGLNAAYVARFDGAAWQPVT